MNTFRTIVETGSFTAAAEKLNYTQSTITFQIGQLEQELSVKLFEKIGRRMVLTKAGDHLIPYVDEVMRSQEKLCSLGHDSCILSQKKTAESNKNDPAIPF